MDEQIRENINKRNLGLSELSSLSGLTTVTLRKYLSRKCPLSDESMYNLAKCLGIGIPNVEHKVDYIIVKKYGKDIFDLFKDMDKLLTEDRVTVLRYLKLQLHDEV